MEKLFLGTVLAGEELDVIDQQRVHLLELALELVHGLFLQRPDHGAEELFRTQIKHFRRRIGLAHRIAGRQHQVGFTQTGAAVQQQRVVCTVARLLRRLERGGQTQLVAAAFDEVGEGVMRVQVAVERHHRCSGSHREPGRDRHRRRFRRTGTGTDLHDHFAKTGEMGEQFSNTRQIAFAHLLDNEGIGCVQHEAVGTLVGL
ncbi:hypothetical protein D3C71_1067640 [compost metagenome]